MSRLLAIIDAYKDAHGGPSDASVARSLGITSSALSSWRKRGLKEPPSMTALRKLADLTHLDFESVVLRAALIDAGWVEATEEDDRQLRRWTG